MNGKRITTIVFCSVILVACVVAAISIATLKPAWFSQWLQPHENQTSADLLDEQRNQTSADLLDGQRNQTSAELLDDQRNQTSAELLDEQRNQTSAESLDEQRNQTSAELLDEQRNQTSAELLDEQPAPSPYSVEEFILDEVDPEIIRSHNRYLSSNPTGGGREGERGKATWVQKTWEEQGMDGVHLVPYNVLISYPKRDTPNVVRLINPNRQVAWSAQGWIKPLYTQKEFSPDAFPDADAYSVSRDIKGDVIYVHFGRMQDFEFLKSRGIDVKGKIVLTRYRETFKADIVSNAERFGALGVVLYPDPEIYGPNGIQSYPDSLHLPISASSVGSAQLTDGDILKPLLQSVDHGQHIQVSKAWLPTIPVQPIGYDDAMKIISQMGGLTAPMAWQGGFNATYKIGPGFITPGRKLGLEVHVYLVQTTTYNVIGVIEGSEEPDRYVIAGNHRDAKLFGAINPSSGTAAMLEVSRVLLDLKNETGWRPRRSIVFCSWGSEEYGLIGSTEWTEEFAKLLAGRAVVYLNVDTPIEGNYTFRAASSPLLAQVLFDAAGKVPNPDEDEITAGRLTVYDTWALRQPDDNHPGTPRLHQIDAESDYKGFQHKLGIPSLDICYTHSRDVNERTLNQRTAVSKDVDIDEDFEFHAALTKIWAVLAVSFADAQLLPLSLMAYSSYITSAYQEVILAIGKHVAKTNLTLAHFGEAVLEFRQAAEELTEKLAFVDTDNPLAVRRANDKLMMVEQAFIDPHGIPGRTDFNHVVVAPPMSSTFSNKAFNGLTDVLEDINMFDQEEQERRWEVFAQHLKAVTYMVDSAAKVLRNDLW
ncbi:putative N-acetylated-alpha-linked acidic dipeptidase [Macrobrachium nipponense]|uniref:putative N-acetylated-alpha-linked acidic dipeptidase n=1 Tax=Macrobrachium nipponense TaxID=159736 RepID=UPI0030C7A8F9